MTDTWLVAITVNPQRRLHRDGKMLGHDLHRELMRLAPDDLGDNPRNEAGLLYRTEHTQDGLRVLAQLTCPPRVEALADGFALHVQQRRLTPLLDGLARGTRVRYRIDANPTKRHGNQAPQHKRGKLANLHGADADLWWLRKATEVGLHPLHLSATAQPDVLGRATHSNKTSTKNTAEDGKPYAAVHGVTRFEGVGIITDPEQVCLAVRTGIGRARTYGCGLLSLGPAPETS